jgi:hypothetical protein
LISRRELLLVVRLLLSVFGAALISVLGVALTIRTGGVVVGWVLVPGGMLALENSRMNENTAWWLYFWAVINLTLWTIVIYAVSDIVKQRWHRGAAA